MDAGDRIVAQLLLGEPEPDPERDQPLLCSIVQVTLDADALKVGRFGNALARVFHVVHRLRQVGHDALMAPGGEHQVADAVQQFLIVAKGHVMDQHHVVADRR